MRTKRAFLVISILFGWTFVIYFIIMRNNLDYNISRKEFRRKLEDLQNDVNIELDNREKLYKDLISVLKAKVAKLTLESNFSLYPESMKEPIVLDAPDSIVHKNEFLVSESKSDIQPIIPVLVFACNRISVSKCLDSLLKYRPNVEQFPIFVSQDCNHEETKRVLLSYKGNITVMFQPDQSELNIPLIHKKFRGYYKIARHYGWALNETFKKGYDNVIIVEDDLIVSPDFFEYFLATQPLLKNDTTLWCISAWNDNSRLGAINILTPEILYRTDFFPGLGWMLTKELWAELSPKWPKAFWDDWIRHPLQRKNRACIRPEVSRTKTFGKIGVSNGLYFDKYLKNMQLSEKFVPFTKMDLTYLLKDNYDKAFKTNVYNSPLISFMKLKKGTISFGGPVRILYNTKEQYKSIATALGLMDDFKSGVPRTGYLGIVSFFYKNKRVYLAPNENWKAYNLSWS